MRFRLRNKVLCGRRGNGSYTACRVQQRTPCRRGHISLTVWEVEVADSASSVDGRAMQPYLRQQPNHRMLWARNGSCGCKSSRQRTPRNGSTVFLRKIGGLRWSTIPPLTAQSVNQLTRALENRSYLSARVEADTVADADKRKMSVNYRLFPGRPHRIRNIQYSFPDRFAEGTCDGRLGPFHRASRRQP